MALKFNILGHHNYMFLLSDIFNPTSYEFIICKAINFYPLS